MRRIRPLPAAPRRARGATLLMALVLLLVLLLFALSAVNSTVLGTRMLGNAQATVQAEAALAVAIEQTISSPANFKNGAARTVNVDIDNDGASDFRVDVTKPVCVATYDVIGGYSVEVVKPRDTYWSYQVTVTDARTGAAEAFTQGVRMRLEPFDPCPE